MPSFLWKTGFPSLPEMAWDHPANFESLIPKNCPICRAKGKIDKQKFETIIYGCGGFYESKPQIQNHTDKYWGQCQFMSNHEWILSFVTAEKETANIKPGYFHSYLRNLNRSYQEYSKAGFVSQIEYVLANAAEWKGDNAKKYKAAWKRINWENVLFGSSPMLEIVDMFA
jgi:hypothetical protein